MKAFVVWMLLPETSRLPTIGTLQLSAVTAILHSALDTQKCVDLNISLNETLPYVPIVNVLSVTHVCLKENLDAALPLFLDESVFSTV